MRAANFAPLFLSALGASLASAQPGAVPARPFTPDDLLAVREVVDPQLSPDGRRVLYGVRTASTAANRRTVRTFLVNADGAGTPRPFPDDTTLAAEARWSPDGRRVAFVSRGQLWIANFDGSDRRQLTRLWGGATGPKWAPGGDRLLFTSRVFPGCDSNGCNADSALRVDRGTVARTYDVLPVRSWDRWDDGTRSHLFVIDLVRAEPRDLTAQLRLDVSPLPFGGSDAYAWSHDGQEVAFAARPETNEAAWGTNRELFVVSATNAAPGGGPNGVPRVLTAANRAADAHPAFTRDGRWLVYLSQRRAGNEADRWRVVLRDRRSGAVRELAPGWDYSAQAFVLDASGRGLLVETQDEGRTTLWRLAFDDDGALVDEPQRLVRQQNSAAFSVALQPGSDGAYTLVWLRDALHRPPEVFTGRYVAASPAGASVRNVRALTRENEAMVARFGFRAAEDVRIARDDDAVVHGFVVRPANFDSTRSWPVVLLIHGGPHSAWLDQWNDRWNAQLVAQQAAGGGAVVVLLNPRGSTGYGQSFSDDVARDWGGAAYEDLMRGLDTLLVRNAWMDSSRIAAAGGSFGGYMTNWMNGRTRRFRAFVTHAGIFNLEALASTTDVPHFTEWELGGPWWQRQPQQVARRNSPHLLAASMRTPTLVTHGERDFRVPFGEGLALFSTLQRRGVPSRLVTFPDEGHWIERPRAQLLWWREVLGWLDGWLTPDESNTATIGR